MKKFIFAFNSPLARGVRRGTPGGVVKKLIFVFTFAVCTVAQAAVNDNAATSQTYVDTGLATKQPTVPAAGANVVMTFDSTADDGIGTKNIYDPSGTYIEQQDSLVMAVTANEAIHLMLDGELVCVGTDPNDDTDCWFWQIRSDVVPMGYTRLEYLVSNGAQYIDTGIAPNNKTGLKVKFNRHGGADTAVVVGVGNGNYSFNGQLWVNTGSRISASFNSHYSDSYIGDGLRINTGYEVSLNYMNDRKVYLDGESELDITNTLVAHNNTMYLFAAHKISTDAPEYFFSGRIYYLQITNGMSLVRNMIPARRDSDGVLGMYDTVTDTFFTNLGSGTFTAGPVVSFLPSGQ